MSFFKPSPILKNHFTAQSTFQGVSSGIAILALASLLTTTTAGPTYAHDVITILHRFQDGSTPNDARQVFGKLVRGSDGFYGVSAGGGVADGGVAFKISDSGVYSILHYFGDGTVANDGINQRAGLTLGSDGNFYGVSMGDVTLGNVGNHAIVYKMTNAGVITVLHQFPSGYANLPSGRLLEVSPGKFYGVTTGAVGSGESAGTVYSITSSGTYSVVHAFGGFNTTDGNSPTCGLIRASDGNFYGTTTHGGGPYNAGTVYRITPAGDYSIIHRFPDVAVAHDGVGPSTELTEGADGALYGVTVAATAQDHGGCIYRITTSGAVTIVHLFFDSLNPTDAQSITNSLTRGSDGTIYGTSSQGGSNGTGTLFQVAPNGVYSIKRNFSSNLPEQSTPLNGVVQDTDGGLIGATAYGYLDPQGTIVRPGTIYKINFVASPTVTQLSPNAAPSGLHSLALTITGANFYPGVTVYLNGQAIPTTLVSTTQLGVTIPSSAMQAPGSLKISVGYPFEGQSTALTLTITAGSMLTSLSPNTVQAGSNDFTFAINGTGFVPSSQVVFNGAYITTHYVTPTQLTATVPRGYITTPAAVNVTVINPGVSPTAPLPFTVTGPAVPARCAPSTVQAGHASFNLSIGGTGFTSSTKAYWNGTLLTTYFISSTQIVATVPAVFVAAPTTATITVTPTTPATDPISFPVTAAPVFTGMTPSTTNAGHADFTLTAIGMGFVVGSQITWNGTPLTTTYVSPTNLTATIPAALVTSAGTATLKVINPGVAPTGPRTFTINP